MGNDQAYVYGNSGSPGAMKIIADPASVRVKMCPVTGPDTINEVEGTVEVDLDRAAVNRAIRDLRKMRDRVFGPDE
jgi:hypothetical protein